MSELLQSVDPATGEAIAAYPAMGALELEELVEEAANAQAEWSRQSLADRAAPLRRLASLLRERARDFAGLMADEMGKPLPQGEAELEKCAFVCEYYAEHAPAMLQGREVDAGPHRSLVTYQPLGVVLAIMPWNFPFWQVMRFLAPTLMAGGGGLLKHAPNVCGCSLTIEGVVREAGFPPALFRSLFIEHTATLDLIDDPRVAAVTLTGSTRAGRAVAERAGRAIKPSVLELGGSDPYVILEDADLELAVRECATSRLINSGQSCIAAKRFVVVESVADEFATRLVESFRSQIVGPPRQAGVDVGPLARADLLETLHAQVLDSVRRGARRLLGGERLDGPGAFYPPTVLGDVEPGMPAYEEELFGPVACVIRAQDEADALRIANDTSFGLGAAVFTRDVERGERLATEELSAGSCFVNGFVRSDPRLPFGGIRESGYGRELAREGILAFVNAKTVVVAGGRSDSGAGD